MFPIYDGRGEPVGFGGRALGTDEGPKYKNSPETPIYQKSRLLYGLNWAKAEIVARGEVVICEGYTDVMAFALAGRATRGRDLRHRARRRALPDPQEPRPQGRARLRRRRGGSGRGREVVPLGAALRDPARGRRIFPPAATRPTCGATIPARLLVGTRTRPRPFLQFRVDRLLAAADLATLEGRARRARRRPRSSAEHPSELVRDQYVMQLAGRLDIDVDRMREAVERARRRWRVGGGAGAADARASRAPGGPGRAAA